MQYKCAIQMQKTRTYNKRTNTNQIKNRHEKKTEDFMEISGRKSLTILIAGLILTAISIAVTSTPGISAGYIFTACAAAIAVIHIMHTKAPEKYSQATWLTIIGIIAAFFHIGVVKEGGLTILLVIYAVLAVCAAIRYGLLSLTKRTNRENSFS